MNNNRPYSIILLKLFSAKMQCCIVHFSVIMKLVKSKLNKNYYCTRILQSDDLLFLTFAKVLHTIKHYFIHHVKKMLFNIMQICRIANIVHRLINWLICQLLSNQLPLSHPGCIYHTLTINRLKNGSDSQLEPYGLHNISVLCCNKFKCSWKKVQN